MKTALKRMLFGPAPWRAHVALGLCRPEQVVKVTLEGCGAPIDVSADHVPAALRPFTIAICLDAAYDAASLRHARPTLVVRDWNAPQATRGRIALRVRDRIALATHTLWLFDVMGSRNYCISPVHVRTRELRERLGRWTRRDSHNFSMTVTDLRAINVYYMRPRPVSLVTVIHGAASNIFPMDLIGPVSAGYFLLALRSTSPAVDLMEQSRRVVVSGIPVSFEQTAYALGVHHRKRSIAWANLPFATKPSPQFGFPVPRDAVIVRDLAIREVRHVGSHTLFIAEVEREMAGPAAPAFCHMAGPYARLRGFIDAGRDGEQT